MHLCQELATLAPFPASCIFSTHTSSLQQEELIEAVPMFSATELTWNDELSFHVDDLIMQATGSNIQDHLLLAAVPNNLCADDSWHDARCEHDDADTDMEHLLLAAVPDNLCADDYWHDARCEHDDADIDMECSVDMWENWLQATSPCQNLNKDASSSACRSLLSGYFSGESSSTFLANMNTSFVDLSRVCSDVSSSASYHHVSHLFISNPVNENFDINLGMQSDATSYDHSSFLQGFVFSDAPMTYSGSTASTRATLDDDFFDSAAWSFAAIANPPPHASNFTRAGASELLLNLEASASQPQLKLGARASPLQQNLETSFHNLNAAGAMRKSSNRRPRQSGEAVGILVESSTPTIDDGHVWYKYGQKDIKGSIHPRSYFKCAQPDCPIKKQTESSSDKQGFVLITYFGRHNH